MASSASRSGRYSPAFPSASVGDAIGCEVTGRTAAGVAADVEIKTLLLRAKILLRDSLLCHAPCRRDATCRCAPWRNQPPRAARRWSRRRAADGGCFPPLATWNPSAQNRSGFPGAWLVIRNRAGDCPVIIAARVGVQTGEAAYAFVKRMPVRSQLIQRRRVQLRIAVSNGDPAIQGRPP